MLLSLVLYGSRARGDHRHASDVDLLGVIEGGKIRRQAGERGVNLHLYPLHYLIEESEQGNLFILHLVSEGRVLHDTAFAFAQVKEAFRYRESYKQDILNATAVMQFLLSNREILNRRKARARLIWGVRTVLIASAAERKEPIFSSAALQGFSGVDGLKQVIDKKYTSPVAMLCEKAEIILRLFGNADLIAKWPEASQDQIDLLVNFSGIAEDTLKIISRFASPSKLDNALNWSPDDYAAFTIRSTEPD